MISCTNNTRGYNPGCIEHVATSSGSHIFYTGGNEKFRISNNGNISSSRNIDCGGGISINGSNAFFFAADIVDAGNRTNTYINFKDAGATSDWCYLRQIGGVNTYKLSLDFHDDENDARFRIRNITSVTNQDGIKEVFTVDNGNITGTGNIYIWELITYILIFV
jgi:hypothetical protein